MTDLTTKCLFVLCFIQGTQNVFVEHKQSLDVTVGQNLSLPCIVSEEDKININQLEWSTADHKLVVFNPAFPVHYASNVRLTLINRTDTGKLRGSILHLSAVTKNDIGDYVCDITTFPNGSIKRITSVQVMDPKVLMEVIGSSRTLVEGDMVKITCVSFPPADSYRLTSSQSDLSMDSQDGNFTMHNITRHSGDLTCQPIWNSSSQHLQGLRSTKPLSVDFLDGIKCNFSSQLQVDTGTNLTITCEAKSSKSLHYVWKKDNLIMSYGVTLSLWSVNTSYSGIYSLTVNAVNHSRLCRQKNFTVTVLDRIFTEHMETTQMSPTALTTAELGTTTVTSRAGHVSNASYGTSTAKAPYVKTTSPPTGNITALQVNVTALRSDVTITATTSAGSSTEGCCKRKNVTSSPFSTQTGITNVHSNVTADGAKNSKQTHVVYILIPILLLLLLIGFLYRRYIIQKRMDMPPPFKPPPPPVKYTSVRDYNISLSDL